MYFIMPLPYKNCGNCLSLGSFSFKNRVKTHLGQLLHHVVLVAYIDQRARVRKL
jgi:hypothetical protein